MDTQLTFFETFDRAELERSVARLKKIGWHVYPPGQVRLVSVSRLIDANLFCRVRDTGDGDRFMEHVDGSAAHEIARELMRQRCIQRSAMIPMTYQYQVGYTLQVVRPNLEMET